VTLVGLVFAMLVATRFIGAAGIYCSAKASSSWRALLGTLMIGYAGSGTIIFFGIPVASLVLFLSYLVLVPFLYVLHEIGVTRLLERLGEIAPEVVVRACNFVISVVTNPALMMTLASTVGIAAFLWKLADRFILEAERRVLKERTPYWKSGINCGYAVEQFMEQFGEPAAVLTEKERPWAEVVEPAGAVSPTR
jgi:hypothetical protein